MTSQLETEPSMQSFGSLHPTLPKPFRCRDCHKEYKKLSGLIQHFHTMHLPLSLSQDHPFGCLIPGCNKRYKNSEGLAYHLEKLHGVVVPGAIQEPNAKKETKKPLTNKEPFVCPHPGCNKVYKNMNGLKYHLSKSKVGGHGPHNMLHPPEPLSLSGHYNIVTHAVPVSPISNEEENSPKRLKLQNSE